MPVDSASRPAPRSAPHSYDALLFDFDGVLADTEHVHFTCWSQTLAPLGVLIDWPWYLANCVGVADHVLAPRFGVGDPIHLVDAKQQCFRAALEESPPFLEGTRAFLQELAASYRMAVVSSSFRTEVEPPLMRAGLDGFFQKILCGDDVTRLKPAPDPYLKAAEFLSARNPLVIEDSDAGIASARAAGFDFVRVKGPAEMVTEVRRRLASLGGAGSSLLHHKLT